MPDALVAAGGSPGLRDLGLLEASLALPRQSFAGADLYPGLIAKAAALGFSLIQNHPFVDGNKRMGHAAMEITAGVEAAEAVMVRRQRGNESGELHAVGDGQPQVCARKLNAELKGLAAAGIELPPLPQGPAAIWSPAAVLRCERCLRHHHQQIEIGIGPGIPRR